MVYVLFTNLNVARLPHLLATRWTAGLIGVHEIANGAPEAWFVDDTGQCQ